MHQGEEMELEEDLAYPLDPFESHQEFLFLLEGITSSANLSARSIGNTAHFAYENAEYAEGLFTALLDSIRFDNDIYCVTIMENLYELCDLVVDFNKKDYSRQEKSGGMANIPAVCKVLSLWRKKDYIEVKAYEKLNRHLSQMLDHAKKAQSISMKDQQSSSSFLNKDQILRKMEEDRDRQKKAREESWIYPKSTASSSNTGAGDAEFKVAWEKARRPNNDDLSLFQRFASRLNDSR